MGNSGTSNAARRRGEPEVQDSPPKARSQGRHKFVNRLTTRRTQFVQLAEGHLPDHVIPVKRALALVVFRRIPSEYHFGTEVIARLGQIDNEV